jgi:predicted 2-oxoglutarate/Fe(II)-dependent dioxygenase YbiX
MDIAEAVYDALYSIDRAGDYCTSNHVPAILLGLEVKGIGPIGLPLTTVQAAELKSRCVQAPHGKGEKTVVDTSVRKVWKLSPKQFKIINPAWQTTLKTIVADVQEKLGLEGHPLEAELYDLLLYEKGGFFLPHKDSEKHDNMVATLVIALPSTYSGGELIVRHDGMEQTIDFSDAESSFDIHYAAFYADCEHEVRPVKSGHRICLVYNLILTRSRKPVTAPRITEHSDKLQKLLHQWRTDKNAPAKVAFLLEHQYTKSGLSWSTLKGTDRGKAMALAEAAQRENFHLYLALLTLHDSGQATGDYDYGDRYGDSDDDEDYEMGEVYDVELKVSDWQTPADKKMPWEGCSLNEDEVFPDDAMREIKPDSQLDGYTGNEGMTLDHWYRHGALILWPDERHEEFLSSNGSRWAVPFFEKMVSRLRKVKEGNGKDRCIKLAKLILQQWPEMEYTWNADQDKQAAETFLRNLIKLADGTLVRRFFHEVMVRDSSAQAEDSVVKAATFLGWKDCQPELKAMFSSTGFYTLKHRARVLQELARTALKTTEKDREAALQVCRQCAPLWLEALQKTDAYTKTQWNYHGTEKKQSEHRIEMVDTFGKALLQLHDEDTLTAFFLYQQTEPTIYSVPSVQVPLVQSLVAFAMDQMQWKSAAFLEWISTCRSTLDQLTAVEPGEPSDWARDDKVGCNCKDCQVLKTFLSDRRESTYRFAAAKQRRAHVRHVFGEKDLSFRTEKKGSPHALVCTKTQTSYKRAAKAYGENLEHLATVQKLEEQYQ